MLKKFRHVYIRWLLCLSLLYTFITFYLRSICWYDPSSIFFHETRAHTPGYSVKRLEQASSLSKVARSLALPKWNNNTDPIVCVGIPSARHERESSLEATLGTLLSGLDERERSKIYISAFLTKLGNDSLVGRDQSVLQNMVDNLSSYSEHSTKFQEAQSLGRMNRREQKERYDYATSLEQCTKVNPQYIMVIEDDVIALDGWLHRMLNALEIVKDRTAQLNRNDFLYLRLFHPEKNIGWNVSHGIYAIFFLLMVFWIRFLLRPHYNAANLWVLFIFAGPFTLTIFFASGRQCMLPVTRGIDLVNQDTQHAQALVYSSDVVLNKLIPHFRANWDTAMQSTEAFIESWADEQQALRFDLNPTIFQHGGGEEILDSDSTTNRRSNYGFELNTVEDLEFEHAFFKSCLPATAKDQLITRYTSNG